MWVARQLGVDHLDAHVDRDLDDLLPVGHGVQALLLGRTGPAVDDDEGRDLDAGFLQRFAILSFGFAGEQGVFVEGIDPRVG